LSTALSSGYTRSWSQIHTRCASPAELDDDDEAIVPSKKKTKLEKKKKSLQHHTRVGGSARLDLRRQDGRNFRVHLDAVETRRVLRRKKKKRGVECDKSDGRSGWETGRERSGRDTSNMRGGGDDDDERYSDIDVDDAGAAKASVGV
jgi:hypothetical protein